MTRTMFPTTKWGLFDNVRDLEAPIRQTALNELAARYWQPVFLFIRQRGFNPTDAEDLTQQFFALWLAKDNFAKPECAKGRFRDFLQTSLRRFLSNEVRDKRAKRRMPTRGIISIQGLVEKEGPLIEPFHEETPEALFNRAWAVGLVRRALALFENESIGTGKTVHFDIFKQRIIQPILEGKEPIAMKTLAEKLCITEKQAANALLTARRAYQRLLREEIRLYARSEVDVSAEKRDIFRCIGKTGGAAQS